MKLEEYRFGNSSKNLIKQSVKIDEITIVLLDDSDVVPKREGYKNLLAVDTLNNILWIADLPSDSMFASYWTIEIDKDELLALSGSFLCKIDLKTGKVLDVRFVK